MGAPRASGLSATANAFRVDSEWVPLRGHPRFQALLERYADDVEH